MKRLLLLLVLGALALPGAPLIQLIPGDGGVETTPGSITGWGFRIVSDQTEWITFIGSFLTNESNPTLGFYQDLIAVQGGPSGFLAPGAPDWVQEFNFNAGTGLGAYIIDPFAQPDGLPNTAQLYVLYERFSDDPSVCSECFLSSGEVVLEVSAAAVPESTVPEPGSLTLMLGGAGAGWWIRRRQRWSSVL
jgi:hypothetical protein